MCSRRGCSTALDEKFPQGGQVLGSLRKEYLLGSEGGHVSKINQRDKHDKLEYNL